MPGAPDEGPMMDSMQGPPVEVPTMDSMPGSTMDSMPGSTVDSMPGSTIDSMPGSTMDSMPGSTVDSMPGAPDEGPEDMIHDPSEFSDGFKSFLQGKGVTNVDGFIKDCGIPEQVK